MGKLGGCKELRVRAGAVLIEGIYMRTVVEAASVLIYGEWMSRYHSLSLIRARECSYPSLEKFYDFPMPTYRSGLERGLTLIV